MNNTSFKPKPCADCGSLWHSKSYHKPRTPLSKPSKPMRRESVKTKAKRQETSREWDKLNPPDENGYWWCYISKHPLCPKYLTKETLVREHDKSKARSSKDKYNVKNIYPACNFDNKAKGSLSAEEYMAKE